jgi:hypothetical protein
MKTQDARTLSPDALFDLRTRVVAAVRGGMSQAEAARVFAGRDCPTVRMDLTVIYPAVKKVFDTYSENLLDPNPSFDDRRKHFKTKFTVSFGIDVTHATL